MGSPEFTWSDFRAVVVASQPGSALSRAASPDKSGWAEINYQLADVFDAIQSNTYAVIRSAGNKAKKPKPYPRPGVKPTRTETQHFGMEPMSIPDLIRELGWEDRPEVQNGRTADAR